MVALTYSGASCPATCLSEMLKPEAGRAHLPSLSAAGRASAKSLGSRTKKVSEDPYDPDKIRHSMKVELDWRRF